MLLNNLITSGKEAFNRGMFFKGKEFFEHGMTDKYFYRPDLFCKGFVLFGIVLLIIIIAAILIIRGVRKKIGSSDEAIEILKVKFAKGEITAEEYSERKKVLKGK